MAGKQAKSWLGKPVVLAAVILFALVANGLFWAVRFPAWFPNDEQQHYLYATHYDGVAPIDSETGPGQVPSDLVAYVELVDFGPHRTTQRLINPSELRPDKMQSLQEQADDPALASVYVDDIEPQDMAIVGHPGFEAYHPPLYFMSLGQVLRISHDAGLGLRWRLLAGRAFSVLLGLLAVGFAVWMARVFWPGQWTLPWLVGLMTGMQVLVAFYTSALNNEVLAYVLFSAFMALGAVAIVRKPSVWVIGAMVLVGLLAGATKITMVIMLPMGLIALMLCRSPRWVKVCSGWAVALMFASALLWLLIPLGGGESLKDSYDSGGNTVRSFPAEMFSPGRLWEHGQMLRWYWGLQIGSAGWADAWMPYKLHYFWSALTLASLVIGGFMLRGLDPQRRKMMLWLLTGPALMALLLYAIDYRFASMIGGFFTVRAQYYIPVAAAQMLWMVWGLVGCFKASKRAWVASGLAAMLMAFNLFTLHRVLSPRYYGEISWWQQCERIADLWPLSAGFVAVLDVLALVTAGLAVPALFLAFKNAETKGGVDLG
ncbi:MAG: hypothetical protein AAF711_15745 [Planctomycetota bacterium]